MPLRYRLRYQDSERTERRLIFWGAVLHAFRQFSGSVCDAVLMTVCDTLGVMMGESVVAYFLLECFSEAFPQLSMVPFDHRRT